MGPKTTQLIAVLEQIGQLLDSDGEKHWRKWLASVRSQLINSDYSGVEYLLDAYGGMGSFNDLVIGQVMVGGRLSWQTDAQEANDKLSALRGEAYELAQYIKHHHELGVRKYGELK
ncbi:MAG: hypothetical protein HOO92_13655 [Methylococcaceae bacterium]|nr:hypothetical protein [Methylococcaceae bacterium]